MKMNNQYFLVFSLVVVVAVQQAQSSHFRGAIISWKPGQNQNEIVIEYRISWRMTYSSNLICDTQKVEKQVRIPGEGSIECFKNCSGLRGDLAYICTDFSLTEDWSSGRGSMTYTYQNLHIEFGFNGSAWINTLNVGSGGSWMLRVTADLTRRSDTGRINSSPTAEISPIVRLAYGCNHTISIPVYDVDGDVVRCHWAASSKGQCADVCRGFPNSTLSFDTCVITYEAIYQTGWYAVAIQVEDYLTNTSTSPLSSIPVQFLVNVESNPTKICKRQIEFIHPTLPENACIGVSIGGTFESVIVAHASSANRSITDVNTISPVGLNKSGLVKVNATDWRLNWTYAPRANETDKNHPFCFTATDNAGFQSKKRCFTLLAGVSPPEFVNGTQLPMNQVLPNNTQWRISTSLEFQRTPRRSFIHLHNKTGGLLESLNASDSSVVTVNTTGRRLEFTTTTKLIEKEEYYFTFDFGVLKGITDCGAESLAVDDPYFWRFRVRDITPPTIQFRNQPNNTNSTAEFAWTVNEPVTTICSLTYPDAYIPVGVSKCNNSWTKSNLTEGYYELLINATDLEGNSATRWNRWFVDTTPPFVRFLPTPANISGSDPVFFVWNCSKPCSTYCSVENLSESCTDKYAWTVGNRQSNVTYTFRLEAVDDVGNAAVIEHKWTTDFDPPIITPCDKGNKIEVGCNSSLKPELICNVTAQDNMDVSPFLNYTDKTVGRCLINRTWTATDDSINVGKYVQSIQIVREGSIEVSQLRPVSVACGTLNNMTEALKSMFVINHPCNLDVQITYIDNATESCDAVIERTWTISDNCGVDVTALQIIKIRKTRLPLAPENGQTGTDLGIYLRWQASTSVGNYSVYLWERELQRPNIPSVVTNKTLYNAKSLKPGTMYRWQVVYNYANDEVYLSPIWVFETRVFADLAVVQIIVPPTVYTGEDFEVKWTVINQGSLATQKSYWTDAVYFSWDGTIQNARLVMTVSRRDILYENDSYSSIATLKFGEMEFGHAYIFVCTNYLRDIEEYNWVNNMKRSLSFIDVKLTAPPDLIVSFIHLLTGRVFSGRRVTFSWTVFNAGAGPTKEGSWFDAVWWSSSNFQDTTAKQMATVQHVGNLQPNTNYTKTLSLQVPEFIYGKHYFTVNVDAFNNVFEYLSENNSLTSKAIEVVLTPPPDLVVNTIYTQTVWRTGEIVIVNWTVENRGNDSPRSQMYWEDAAVITYDCLKFELQVAWKLVFC